MVQAIQQQSSQLCVRKNEDTELLFRQGREPWASKSSELASLKAAAASILFVVEA